MGKILKDDQRELDALNAQLADDSDLNEIAELNAQVSGGSDQDEIDALNAQLAGDPDQRETMTFAVSMSFLFRNLSGNLRYNGVNLSEGSGTRV